MVLQRNEYIARRRLRHDARGFTFTEILFAVMILGIGFIMVAAMFPVAIRQTQETVEQTTAAMVAKDAGSLLNRIAPPFQSVGSTTFYTNFPVSNPPSVAQNYGGGNLIDVIGFRGPDSGVTFPPSNATMQTTSFWQALQGNLIYSTDTRFAFVPLYLRGIDASTAPTSTGDNTTPPAGTAQPSAEVIIVVVQARNYSNFTTADVTSFQTASGQQAPPNLLARPLLALFTSSDTGPDTVQFKADNPTTESAAGIADPPDTLLVGGSNLSDPTMVAEGTYVIVADDSKTYNWNNRNPQVSCAGSIFRVGNRALDSNGSIMTDTWELAPGNDMKNMKYAMTSSSPNPTFKSASGTVPNVRVFVVGRGYTQPGPMGQATFTGPAMDVAVFSSFVKCR